MRMLKAPGTPLRDTGLLDEHHERKLRAVGVTTVEELFGLIRATPEATGRFLEGSNLAMLQNEALAQVAPQRMAAMEEVEKHEFSFGALPPPGVEVERLSPESKFEELIERYPPGAVAFGGEEGVDLRECFSPIRDQQNRGTCVAHAVVALMECFYRRAGESLDLSEQWLYWVCKERDGAPNDEGTQIFVATEIAVGDGVCLEDTWPYEPDEIPGNEGQGPPPSGAAQEAANRRMGSWDELADRSAAAIQAALDETLPVAIGVPVYDNWASNPAANASGDIPMPLPFSVLEGGHAMAIVGYDFDSDVPGGAGFIVRNSWGEDWANDSAIGPGYGVLPFPYVEQYGWGAYVLRP